MEQARPARPMCYDLNYLGILILKINKGNAGFCTCIIGLRLCELCTYVSGILFSVCDVLKVNLEIKFILNMKGQFT